MQDSLDGAWVQERERSSESLAALNDLNQCFLDLLTPADDWNSRCGLPAATVAALTGLPSAQRASVAHCPYALFDLRFADDAHWQGRLGGSWHWQVADGTDNREWREFASVCLFYAWHVAAGSAEHARLLLGMSSDTAATFRRVKLQRLASLAASEAQHLRARWHQMPSYWNALIEAASRADSRALRRAQLHGLQLTAAARLA